jgi:hypothetical protein
MGSRYLFIVLYLRLERALTRRDYRPPASEIFTPWPRAGEGTSPEKAAIEFIRSTPHRP